MKKLFYLSLVLLAVFSLNSCFEKSKEQPEKKFRLSEYSTNSEGETVLAKFNYSQGNLSQVLVLDQGIESVKHDFKYNSEGVLIQHATEEGDNYSEINYEYTDQFILGDYGDNTFVEHHFDADGNINYSRYYGVIQGEEETGGAFYYNWENGNCTLEKGCNKEAEHVYDHYNSPFRFQFLIVETPALLSKNNPIETISTGNKSQGIAKSTHSFFPYFPSQSRGFKSVKKITYEYNEFNYPIKSYLYDEEGELLSSYDFTYEEY